MNSLPHLFALANGDVWTISSDPSLCEWFRRFTRIMGLKPSNVELNNRQLNYTKERPPGCCECDDFRLLKFWYNSGDPAKICELVPVEGDNTVIDFIRMSNSLVWIYMEALCAGGMPLHAALLKYNGKGVAIAAPGDTGKSTCAERVPASWEVLCDDLCLVVPDSGGRYYAQPLPTWSRFFNESSCDDRWDTCRKIPLNGIFFLEQADHDEAAAIGRGEATTGIARSSGQIMEIFLRRMEDERAGLSRRRIFENACEVADRIPSFILRASLNGRFWEEIEGLI